MLNDATNLEINPEFLKVCENSPLIYVSPDIIKDLSTDQSYAYQIVTSIKTGVLPKRLALLEIGPVCHSRSLTTALRICRIWVSKHGLTGDLLNRLKMIVEHIVGVYIPNWFCIKVNSCWVEGAINLLKHMQILKNQTQEVIDIVLPTFKRSAWYAHPESVLQSMLCSQIEDERKEAVDKIVKIRGAGNEALHFNLEIF